MGVEVLYYLQSCLCGVPHVHIFQRVLAGFAEGGYELVIQGGVDHPLLVVLISLLFVFLGGGLLLPGRRLFWEVLRSSPGLFSGRRRCLRYKNISWA